MKDKTAFVTVGTLEFDQLIISVTSKHVCKALRSLGFTRLVLQTGRGQFQPEATELSDQYPAVESFTFKDSIADDINAADLVICHAGAGSVLETLTAGRATLVVINDELMNNHQEELAKQMQKIHHLFYCTCSTLQQTLESADFTTLQPYRPGDPALLVSHLQSLCTTPTFSKPRVFACHLCWTGTIALVYMWMPIAVLFLLLIVFCLGVFTFCGSVKSCNKK